MTRDLKQGSQEWLDARKNLLTASNSAAAMGICPYKSRQKLYRELTGEDPPFTGNEATDWGITHEPDARFSYEAATGEFVTETGLWVHSDHNWLGASLDGLVSDGIVEFKCKFSQELWTEVPPHYMAQIQMQLEIADRDWCDFVSWVPGSISMFRVQRSREYWDAQLILLTDFWDCMLELTPPKRRKKPVMPEVEIG